MRLPHPCDFCTDDAHWSRQFQHWLCHDCWVAQMQERICDCIASGNTDKPKQHGADPHAKNCAVYRG